MPESHRDILIATNNPGKFREIVAVLGENVETLDPWLKGSKRRNVEMGSMGEGKALSDQGTEVERVGIRWRSLVDLPHAIPEPHEDQSTFVGNAALKAAYYSKAAGMWALADDSGLEVDALGGEPGVHSAFYARESAHLPREERDRANNAKLMAALANVPPDKRTARYRCVLVLADGDRILATTEGTFEGVMVETPRGAGGFGYDPYFLVPALGKTVAELPVYEKNRLSHRGQALRIMRQKLSELQMNSDQPEAPARE